jgi:glutamate synthase (NADPH/NADH) small chain
MGYEVTIFEALHAAGGVLIYGIPEFRLPKSIVKMETRSDAGSRRQDRVQRGRRKDITMQEIMEEFDACYIAVGAGAPHFHGIPGTNAQRCILGQRIPHKDQPHARLRVPEFDTPTKKFNKVVVIGGGNVAMDAAQLCKETGAEEVTIVYRRSR